MPQKINQAGLDLIKQFEGLELEAYVCPTGHLTIGYGHTGNVNEGDVITEEEAEDLLRKDVKSFEKEVFALLTVDVNTNEFSALVSLAFNIGSHNLKYSTVLRELNNENRRAAAEAITWWNKGRVNGVLTELEGLVRRRKAEKELFLKPVQ